MSDARTVIAEVLCDPQDVKARYLGKPCSEHYDEADAILAALADAGLEIISTAKLDALRMIAAAAMEGSE
jgi:methylmalonyl-CoA mutase cobalamin-binding subunit